MSANHNILIIGTLAVALVGGVASSAFAGPRDGIETAQYLGQETGRPLPTPRFTAEKLHVQSLQTGSDTLIAPANPHWGPAFDPDVE